MKPEILEIEPRKIIGKCVTTTLSFDDTAALWQDFMSRHKEIKNCVDSGFYSMQVYPSGFKVEEFTRETEFERWAAVLWTSGGAKISLCHSYTSRWCRWIFVCNLQCYFISSQKRAEVLFTNHCNGSW